jgi:hypothetical protein
MTQINLFTLPQVQPYHYRTSAVALERFCAGDSITCLADDYYCNESDIENILREEIKLKLAPKSKTHLKKLLACYIPREVPSKRFRKLLYLIRYATLHKFEDSLPPWVLPSYKKELAAFVLNLSADHGKS